MKRPNTDTVVSFSKNQWREKMTARKRKIDIRAEQVRTWCANASTPQSGHVETTAPPLLKEERQDG
jgi:hypothetical protein